MNHCLPFSRPILPRPILPRPTLPRTPGPRIPEPRIPEPRAFLSVSLAVACALLAAAAQAQPRREETNPNAPAATPPAALSDAAQKIGPRYYPLVQQSAPKSIQREEDARFRRLPRDVPRGPLPLPGNVYYPLPARVGEGEGNGADRVVVTRPTETTPSYGIGTSGDSALGDAARGVPAANMAAEPASGKQAILDAARAQSAPAANDAEGGEVQHGVRVTRGSGGGGSGGATGIGTQGDPAMAPAATVPYGARSAQSSAPKGDRAIDPALREDAARRTAEAGDRADPLDVLLQDAR